MVYSKSSKISLGTLFKLLGSIAKSNKNENLSSSGNGDSMIKGKQNRRDQLKRNQYLFSSRRLYIRVGPEFSPILK